MVKVLATGLIVLAQPMTCSQVGTETLMIDDIIAKLVNTDDTTLTERLPSSHVAKATPIASPVDNRHQIENQNSRKMRGEVVRFNPRFITRL